MKIPCRDAAGNFHTVRGKSRTNFSRRPRRRGGERPGGRNGEGEPVRVARRRVRKLAEDDDDFILDLVPRFTAFALPAWRKRHECIEGIRRDIARHLDEAPPNSYLFVAENADGDWQTLLRQWVRAQLTRGRTGLLEQAGNELERILIEEALRMTGGHRQKAARVLGVGRNTLTRKLQELGE